MNREYFIFNANRQCVPREHGDEPSVTWNAVSSGRVFPVSTGMNRGLSTQQFLVGCVPREHGDEPIDACIARWSEGCSP